MNSVKSSWAMWIHHSWGSLMKIQMNAAIPTTATCADPQGVPTGAHELVGDEEVLEGVREDEQQPPPAEELEQGDADEAVEVQEAACRKATGSRQLRIVEM